MPSPLTTKKAETKTPEQHVVTFKTFDEDQQIAYGVVYEPFVIDTHGDMMLPEDVAVMAERFMELPDVAKRIDMMHDNVPVSAYPIDSYIADGQDGVYNEGAWVLGIKIEDPTLWFEIKTGQYNGYSFEAMVKKVPVVVEIEYEQDQLGYTEETLGHTHLFFLKLNEDGVVVGGRTSTDLGHSHEIRAGTGTEESLGHAHRFDF